VRQAQHKDTSFYKLVTIPEKVVSCKTNVIINKIKQ